MLLRTERVARSSQAPALEAPTFSARAAESGTMTASALCEAAKHGDVDELRQLLANASPGDVNVGEPKHGYRPLHYGVWRLAGMRGRQLAMSWLSKHNV